MAELIIKVPLTEQEAAFFAERDMMVTPLSDFEAGQLGAALGAIAKTIALNAKALATLGQVLESRGFDAHDVLKTVGMMVLPNRDAESQVDYVRTLLGRSALVGRDGLTKAVLQ